MGSCQPTESAVIEHKILPISEYKNMPCAQPRSMLRLKRVRQVKTLRRVFEVEKISRNIGIPFQISNAKRSTSLQNMGPGRSTWEQFTT